SRAYRTFSPPARAADGALARALRQRAVHGGLRQPGAGSRAGGARPARIPRPAVGRALSRFPRCRAAGTDRKRVAGTRSAAHALERALAPLRAAAARYRRPLGRLSDRAPDTVGARHARDPGANRGAYENVRIR